MQIVQALQIWIFYFKRRSKKSSKIKKNALRGKAARDENEGSVWVRAGWLRGYLEETNAVSWYSQGSRAPVSPSRGFSVSSSSSSLGALPPSSLDTNPEEEAEARNY